MTVIAVKLAMENEDRLQRAQEYLYKPIARQLDCDFRSVERDLRTMIAHAWRNNPDYLSHLAGFPLPQPPTVLQFLDTLVTFSLRELSQSYA